MISLDGPSVFDNMPADVYHADPSPEPSMSSGIAKILVTQSPLHAWHAHPRLNPNYIAEMNGDFDRGSAAHALFLQGEDIMVECAFNDWRTNASKDARAEARAAGKLPLLSKHVGAVCAMVAIAKRALEDSVGCGIERFHAERTVIWNDHGIWKRARFDLEHHTRDMLLDYKTTENADPFAFARAIVPLGYDVQAAHYSDAYMAKEGIEDEPDFLFLVQEREPPYACSLVGLEPALMDLGKRKVERASKIWADCISTGKWPGYPQNIAWVDAPAWALSDFEARRISS